MILVDTSVWIDHFHGSEPRLVAYLEEDQVGCHPAVIEELALGSIKRRDAVLSLLENLRSFPALTHAEVITMVSARKLWGRGLSSVDAHLLGSVAVHPGAAMWTRDKRLLDVCRDAGVAYLEEE